MGPSIQWKLLGLTLTLGEGVGVSLYKILFQFKAVVRESIILLLPPPPTCNAYPIAILMHGHCAIYASPPTPPLYAIHHTILVMAISCKGQGRGRGMLCVFFLGGGSRVPHCCEAVACGIRALMGRFLLSGGLSLCVRVSGLFCCRVFCCRVRVRVTC